MSDKKLEELIEDFAKCVLYADCDVVNKAKQAIVDYVEGKVKQLEYALQCEIGRTKWVKDICGESLFDKYNDRLRSAIAGLAWHYVTQNPLPDDKYKEIHKLLTELRIEVDDRKGKK